MNILESELFILSPVVVVCGCILFNMNGYTTAMEYTMVVIIHHIVLHQTSDIILIPDTNWSSRAVT